jgi:hypothetical protein
MTEERFSCILELKASGVVEALMKDAGMSMDEAITCFYHSKVYQTLAIEETKLWHHSPMLLLDCIKSELRTGTPEYPDE